MLALLFNAQTLSECASQPPNSNRPGNSQQMPQCPSNLRLNAGHRQERTAPAKSVAHHSACQRQRHHGRHLSFFKVDIYASSSMKPSICRVCLGSCVPVSTAHHVFAHVQSTAIQHECCIQCRNFTNMFRQAVSQQKWFSDGGKKQLFHDKFIRVSYGFFLNRFRSSVLRDQTLKNPAP